MLWQVTIASIGHRPEVDREGWNLNREEEATGRERVFLALLDRTLTKQGQLVDRFPNRLSLLARALTDEDVAVMTSLSGWRMYFDGATNHSGYGIGVLLISPHETALKLGIRQMEVFGDSNLVLRQIQGHWKTRDVKLWPYHAYLELLVWRFDDLSNKHLPRTQNQFVDVLATLASMIDIPTDTVVRPLLIESRSVPAYCCLIDEAKLDDGLPWYHDIYQFLRLSGD
ncbi:hypothetical protein CK203_036778 [Vitis vinifera]|uniref:RNase H type-1 domain-containing protein n=1 Tax=Vitis vinifera TaxID=29760 RepID=A0A438I0M4_VITVI|nr:hypothetical protein CK203_036778 [Vitis vinifera]